MPTVNGPDEITTLEGGNNKVFYSNNSGEITELALGASGTVLTSAGTDATANPPTWETPAGGDTLSFTANGALTAGNAAVLDADGKVSAAVNTLTGNTIGATTFTNWHTATWAVQTGYSTSVYDPILDMNILK